MAKTKLPANWCVLRTEDNQADVNQYFNTKFNYSGWYSGGEEKYFTNNTEKEKKRGPYNSKPEKYTLLTFEEFLALVVNAIPAPAAGKATTNGLPNYWAVKYSTEPEFKSVVLPVLNKLRKPSETQLSGNSPRGYYGYDGAARSTFELNEFSKEVQLLTVPEFVALLGSAGTERGASGIGERDISNDSRSARPAATPPKPARAQIPCDYTLTKKYPGGPAVGSLASANLPNYAGATDGRCIGDYSEYWTPIMRDVPQAGDFVKLKVNNGGHMSVGSVHKVISTTQSNGRPIITIASGHNIYYDTTTTPTAEEIALASAITINGRKMTKVGNRVQFGTALLTQPYLEGIKSLITDEGVAKITIANMNITAETVDAALALFD